MQRFSRGVIVAATLRMRCAPICATHARFLAPLASSAAPVLPSQARFLSIDTSAEPESLSRYGRRRLKKKQKAQSVRKATADGARPAPATATAAEAAAPQKPPKKKMRLNVHYSVVVLGESLASVFPRLQEQVRTRGLRVPSVRQAVDTFYFHSALQAESGLPDAFRRELARYFDQELFACESSAAPFVLGQTLNEAVFGSVIKLHLASDDAQAAWALLDKLRRVAVAADDAKAAKKLHFRTVSPLLAHECKRGRFVHAFGRWQRLKRHDVEWTSAMEDALVHMVVACIEHSQQPTATVTPRKTNEDESEQHEDSHFHAQMASLLHDLQVACREVSKPNTQRLRQAFQAAGYHTHTVASDAHMTPRCPCCGRALLKQGLSATEHELMLSAIESRRSSVMPADATAKDFLAPFREWLMAKHETFLAAKRPGDVSLHFVLDGPNVAYLNQNFEAGSCRVDQVDAVARRLQAQGHLVSITMPGSYLQDKFVLRIHTRQTKAARKAGRYVTRERSDADKRVLQRWRDDGLVFSCRTDCLSDDLYWLYASVLLGRHGRVVTNDQGRDHVFAMLNSDGHAHTSARGHGVQPRVKAFADDTAPISMDLIARWKDMTTVNIEIKHEEVDVAAQAEAQGEAAPIAIEEIRLLHPRPFSRVPQVTAPRHFHFPIAEQSLQHEHPNQNQRRQRSRWLCAHR